MITIRHAKVNPVSHFIVGGAFFSFFFFLTSVAPVPAITPNEEGVKKGEFVTLTKESSKTDIVKSTDKKPDAVFLAVKLPDEFSVDKLDGDIPNEKIDLEQPDNAFLVAKPQHSFANEKTGRDAKPDFNMKPDQKHRPEIIPAFEEPQVSNRPDTNSPIKEMDLKVNLDHEFFIERFPIEPLVKEFNFVKDPIVSTEKPDFKSPAHKPNAEKENEDTASFEAVSSGDKWPQLRPAATANRGVVWQHRNASYFDSFRRDNRPIYYTAYSDSDGIIAGKRYQLTKEIKELVIYSKDQNVKASVEKEQIVRILAKAEAGETLWVFIETPYHPQAVYAKTYSYKLGSTEKLREFNANANDAYKMYYVKNYGDTILDLGYADYSKLAGYNGEVTITVKKGEEPKSLKTIQRVTLSYR